MTYCEVFDRPTLQPEIYLRSIAKASSKNSNAIGIDRRLYG
ncbi:MULTISPECIES: hypothetical protein [unclassified Microcoleus]